MTFEEYWNKECNENYYGIPQEINDGFKKIAEKAWNAALENSKLEAVDNDIFYEGYVRLHLTLLSR